MALSPREEIINSFIQGDWEKVLDLQCHLNEAYFLWPKPERSDLYFIEQVLRRCNVTSVVSIGSGTGLLEWLLIKSTGLNVKGIEVDKKYWNSKYARGSFIQLLFPEDENYTQIKHERNNALMFCYFNNENAFYNYLKEFESHILIIIGPHKSGRHTDPGPFDPKIPPEWKLYEWKSIGETGDYIAIYRNLNKQVLK